MYDPNDEAYLAKLSESPLAIPDDAYSANLQAYLAAQNALPRTDRNVTFEAPVVEEIDGMLAPAATPAVKKAVKKLKKAISTADARDLGGVPATIPIPATNPQGVILPPAIAGSAAGLAMQGKTGMTYPSWSSMVPDFMKKLFRASVAENTNAARNKEWGAAAGWSPDNKYGPVSRTPLP